MSSVRCVTKHVRRTLAIALAVTAAHAAHPAHADADTEPFHWGYSAMFGRGTYVLGDGGEADVYRGAFKVRLRAPAEEPGGRPGLRLLLPVAVGLNETGGVTSEEDDDSEIKLATFLPGIELELTMGERWRLRTSARLGAGREFNAADGTRESVRLAAFGVRSRFVFAALPGQPALINGLLWAGFDAKDRIEAGTDGLNGTTATAVDGERASLLRLTNALEFHVPTPRWEFRERPMHLRPHVLSDRYYRPPSGLSLGDADEPPPLKREWQVGVAAGREDGFKILFLEFDSVGIAYRFSEHNDGLRFYLNSVF
jgi:hypothetical protein